MELKDNRDVVEYERVRRQKKSVLGKIGHVLGHNIITNTDTYVEKMREMGVSGERLEKFKKGIEYSGPNG